MSEAAVAVDKPAPAIRTLTEARMGLAESKRQDWVVNAEEGTTVEQVLDPMYWAHVGPKFTLYDRVDVRVDTGEWMLELIVIQTGRNFARVHARRTTSPTRPAPRPRRARSSTRSNTRARTRSTASSASPTARCCRRASRPRPMANEWLANYERVTTS
jgi:hypothetical protein